MPADVDVEAVDANGVTAHWLRTPDGGEGRVLFFVHGGGFVLGSLRSHGELASRLGRVAGMAVLFVAYRLAPEHPFPAAVDDVVAAWEWLTADRGVAPRSVVVVGDSAGGGLCLSLLQHLRDRRMGLPAAAVLLSPWTDLTGSGGSLVGRAAEDWLLTPERGEELVSWYLAGADPTVPAASPLFGSMAGLPRLLIQVGTAEILLSDSERLADAAEAAGVDVTLQVGHGLPHVYQGMLGTPEAEAATEAIGAFLAGRP